MRRMYHRSGRMAVIASTALVYVLLLIVDAQRFFLDRRAAPGLLPQLWEQFGFSALVALLFLAVGTLVWLYARNRSVAIVLFCFSFSMMVTFAVQTGALIEDQFLTFLSETGGAIALLMFSLLLLLFPTNYFAQFRQAHGSTSGSQTGRRAVKSLLLPGYLALTGLLGLVTITNFALFARNELDLTSWMKAIGYSYYLIVQSGILLTIILSYRKSSTLRERQQLRFFVIGVVLAFSPFLVFTLLPLVLGLPAGYVLNSQFSTSTVILLPISLGYSILRYQMLVFDKYIRRAVAWTVGSISIGILGYLVVLVSNITLSNNVALNMGAIVLSLLILSPFTWWLAHVGTERMFFNEMRHYRRILERPGLLTRKTFDLEEAADLITLAFINTFETRELCLLVLDNESGNFIPVPMLEDTKEDAARARLTHLLEEMSAEERPQSEASPLTLSGWFDAGLPFLARVAGAKRPLFLSEATSADGHIARYLSPVSTMENDPLLVPVRAQDRMIGLLILGPRGDRQPYAGPDFEIIDLALSHYAPILETARLYRQASRHVEILNALYGVATRLEKAYTDVGEAAQAYTVAVADSLALGAEIWLCDESASLLRRLSHEGAGPRLLDRERLELSETFRWESLYYEGDSHHARQGTSEQVPACLPEPPRFPFAWLPLKKGEHSYGFFVLTYGTPHIFSHEEKRILGMFADQCAAEMERVEMNAALRAAYERQKELDRLKDQFIMTASHELRTPLTAVQGFVELLATYGARLSDEERANFVAKAQRGCDELTLMVGNIMDASRVQIDVEQLHLAPVSLADSVAHVLEIEEGLMIRQDRKVLVDIAPDILIMADGQRLRQILLNLVGNALKYSPAGSRLEISAHSDDTQATLRIRDFGAGVQPEDQQRLFERFVRLERDMNSPVRGAGLGLYISKQLVEAMGGHIWVESTGVPGKGSVFAFSLKLHQPALALRS